MNNPHKNARTTVHSRARMVARRADGRPVAQIADELSVSERTVWKWLRRHREGGRLALDNRASAAPASAGPDAWIAMAVRLRREYRLAAAEIADKLRMARSTVARWLRRAGVGRHRAGARRGETQARQHRLQLRPAGLPRTPARHEVSLLEIVCERINPTRITSLRRQRHANEAVCAPTNPRITRSPGSCGCSATYGLYAALDLPRLEDVTRRVDFGFDRLVDVNDRHS